MNSEAPIQVDRALVALARAAAYSHARSHRLPACIDVDDLTQAALIAASRALPAFDPDRGVALATFLHPTMRNAMIDEARRVDPLSRPVRDQVLKIAKATRQLEHRLLRAPRTSEIAAELGFSLEQLHAVYAAAQPPEVEDAVEAEHDAVIEARERSAALEVALNTLTERERTCVVDWLAGLEAAESAAKFGVCDSRVSQLITGAIEKMRRSVRRQSWGHYSGPAAAHRNPTTFARKESPCAQQMTSKTQNASDPSERRS